MRESHCARRGLAVLAAAIGFGIFAGQSNAQVSFTVPGDAPDGGAGSVGVLQVTGAGGIGDQQAARNALMGLSGGTRTILPAAPTINFKGDGGATGRFGGDIALPAGNDKSYLFRGNLNIPAAGVYTFNINSDDGFTLAFNNGTVPFANPTNASVESYNGNGNGAFQFFGGRGASDSLAQITFPAAGAYHFDLTYHDGCCDDSIDVSVARGAKTAFSREFVLLGSNTAPGTQQRRAGLITTPFQTAAVHGNNSANLSDAITDLGAVLGGGAPAPRGGGTPLVATGNSQTLNFADPQNANTGGLDPFQTFPGDTGADDNNFSFGARGGLTIPAGQGGHYTFLAFSDDSSRTRIINAATNIPVALLNTVGGIAGGVDTNSDGIKDAFTNDGNCCSDILGTYDLPTGNYIVESVMNEQVGGSSLFLLGQIGDQTAWNPGFQLLGANLDDSVQTGGDFSLVAVPEPGTFGLLALGAVAFLARRKRA